MVRQRVMFAGTLFAATGVLAGNGIAASAEPPGEPRCTNVRSRPIPAGRPGRSHWVVGREPILLGGFRPRSATPASLVQDTDRTMIASQFYFVVRDPVPNVITLTGWRFRDRTTRLLLGGVDTGPTGTTLILRRGHSLAASLRAPTPGCYVVHARWRGGQMRVRIDLRREVVLIPPPP